MNLPIPGQTPVSPPPGGLEGRRQWWRVLRWVLLAAVLAGLGRFLWARRQEVAEALSHLTAGALLAMVALEAANHLLTGGRLYLVAREHGERVTVGGALRLYLVGRFLNSFVPQVGNVYRGVQFKRLFGVGYGRYAAILGVFSWLSLVLTLALAAMVLVVGSPPPAAADPLPAVLVALAALVVAPFAARTLVALAARWSSAAAFPARWTTRAGDLLHTLVGPMQRRRLLVPFLLSTLLSFVLWVAYYGTAFHALGVAPGIGAVAVMVCLVRLGSVFTITPANVGVLEVASGALMGWLGFGIADGVLAMGLVRAVALVVSTGLALIAGWRDVVEAVGGDGVA